MAETAKVIKYPTRFKYRFGEQLAIIFRQMGVDTLDVLEAAGAVEFPTVSAWLGGRTLYWCRSLLPPAHKAKS